VPAEIGTADQALASLTFCTCLAYMGHLSPDRVGGWIVVYPTIIQNLYIDGKM
jgi:hypothetical protein